MITHRWNRSSRAVLLASLLVLATSFAAISAQQPDKAASLPDKLGDAEFWALETSISEPGGYFQITDNYTSNEMEIGQMFGMLRDADVHGGVYLGVGPEQNFTYIAAVRPVMAFVVDIRRQAVMQHLMFKAVFELSKDRADFISLLFSKPRPDGIDDSTPIQEIWSKYTGVATDQKAMAGNAERIVNHLTKTHGFTFTDSEMSQLTSVIDAFEQYGPVISTRGGAGFGRGGGNGSTFADLTGWSTDSSGQPRSFLATEEDFRYVKQLQEKNLVVPVSGDFGGPKAIRAIGDYLKKQGGTVSSFYVSNVEQYLFQDRKQGAFYDNVAALPLNAGSVFIRPYSLRQFRSPVLALCPMASFVEAASKGLIRSNYDSLSCAR